MTREEALKIAAIFLEADGGLCSSCVTGLIKRANKIFPEFNWAELCKEASEGEFDGESFV